MRGLENRTFTACTVGMRVLPIQTCRYTGVPGAVVSGGRGKSDPEYAPTGVSPSTFHTSASSCSSRGVPHEQSPPGLAAAHRS